MSNSSSSSSSYKKKPDMEVAILGAGISGIGAAYHLKYDKNKNHTGTRDYSAQRSGASTIDFQIFERRAQLGGTWDLFKYPGIRSDAEMVNFSFPFFPWKHKDRYGNGDVILKYLNDTCETFGLDKHMKFNSDVQNLSWSDEDGCWTLTVNKVGTNETYKVTAQFVIMGTGYYSYSDPHFPKFPEQDKFKGEIVHAQFWKPDTEYENKKVVIIGSGATAISIMPAIAQKTEHTTMLQRTPTYVVPFPRRQWTTDFLNDYIVKYCPNFVFFWIALIMRWYANFMSMFFFYMTRKYPAKATKNLLGIVKHKLGPNHQQYRQHLDPSAFGIAPWDQRICVDTGSDMFKALKSDKASIETATIEKLDETGLVVKCMLGDDKDKIKHIDADLIIAATGLKIESCGGAKVFINGKPLIIGEAYYYRGSMFKDIPNFFNVFGYFNQSWFNKSLLIADYAERVISHCKKNNYRVVCPRPLPSDDIGDESLVTFMTSGYLQRGKDHMPRQGNAWPWKMYQNYFMDYALIRWAPMTDPRMEYKKE